MRRLLLAAAAGMLSAAPAWALSAKDAAQRDKLIAALQAAPDTATAATIEARLRTLWRKAGSPAGTLLLDRAAREIRSGSADVAIEDADAVVLLDPDYAEAYVVRATAKLANGDATGSVRDVAEALRREPRHIDALMLLSHAAEARGDFAAAYAAWQQVLEVDPKTADGDSRLRELRRRAVGENI